MKRKHEKILHSALIAGLLSGLAACAAGPDAPLVSEAAPVIEDPYSSAALERHDYAAAAHALEAQDETDPLVQLNLALAYAHMDRVDEAMRLYQSVLDQVGNPYVVIDENRAPMRVKTIAEDALVRLETRTPAR